MRLIVNNGLMGSNNAIHFYLPTTVKVKSIELISVNIPYSFYNITSSNNTFIINDIEYTLENQQYNAILLTRDINVLISSTGIICTYSRQKNKFTFTSTSASFTFNPFNLGVIFGFPKLKHNMLYYSEFINLDHSLTSINMCDFMNGIRSLYINSNIQSDIVVNESYQHNILYAIPIRDTKFGDMIYDDNISNISIFTEDIRIITLSITDSNFNLIDFNGIPYELKFNLNTYDDDEIMEMSQQKIQNNELYKAILEKSTN